MEPNIATIGSLVGDQARSKMLIALMGGKALTATELSLEADISAQTASSHLAKLVESGLLVVRKQGRHRYFQLKGEEVAGLIENMLNISSSLSEESVFTGPKDKNLRASRICYDHMAGELSTQLYESLVDKQFIKDNISESTLSEEGRQFFFDLGADLSELAGLKRPLCKPCLDWSERKSHLAGSIGKWVLSDVIQRKWAKRDLNSRALRFSDDGLKAFKKRYGL
ncbi:winged helix-turn-helix domain-containing protein [uncultured Pseudoteredinibacter sp.]|uniref:ArsR/SmtB family transcription factor n=1 Tax=uncultured Pseudoteredinibacter sp. TaxID=1641701 RepID=UPI00260E467E|nr:winged helix-turn-helix domain-containing protein [uncultured Pseudoteredinibacter sp.]